MAVKNHDTLIKTLQILSGFFMLAMIVLCLYFMKKLNINILHIEDLADLIHGNTLEIALYIIAFSVVKTFALIFPPGVVFAVCGFLMPDFFSGVLVNFVALLLSFPLGFYLGKFTGSGMVSALEKRFKTVRKIEHFADANETMMTFAIKLAGIIPNDMSSLLFGAMNVSFKNFMIGSTLGSIPLIISYSALGLVLRTAENKFWLVLLLTAMIVVYIVIASVITKVFISKAKNMKDEPETEK